MVNRRLGDKHFHGDSLGLYEGAIVGCGILNYGESMCTLCI